jgi:hypothetical protein
MRLKRIALIAVAALFLVIFWPWLGNPFNYVHLRDSVRTSVPIAMMLGEPCTTRKNGVIDYDSGPNCIRFARPQRFRGIWLYEFEGSTFLENATAVPSKRPDYGDTAWLMYDPSAIDRKPDYDEYAKDRDCFAIHAFEIEFIGRRSPEGHGHLGLFRSEIWVQKMIRAKPLTAPKCETYLGQS